MTLKPELLDELEGMSPQQRAESLQKLEAEHGNGHKPTSLREAANSHWVVVSGDFTDKIIAADIVTVCFRFDEHNSISFFVHKSIEADEVRFNAFYDQVLDEWFDMIPPNDPAHSLRTLRLDDIPPDCRKLGIFNISDMAEEVQKLHKMPFLLEGYIRARSITVMIGGSGIGKSPLNYELGLCIATGTPFLGIPTTRGRVLYLDFENNTDAIVDIAQKIALQHLKLQGVPDAFQVWSPAMEPSDAGGGFNVPKLLALTRKFKPDLVIIDTLSASFPAAENQAENVATIYRELKASKTGAAFLFKHHLTKDSDSADFLAAFDTLPIADVFKDTRGSGAIVYNADMRFRLAKPPLTRGAPPPDAFRMRGYLRGVGETPKIKVSRILNNDGDPIGHHRLGGVETLSAEHGSVFENLPDEFRWKDLETYFGNSESKKSQFIAACFSAAIITKDSSTKIYRRIIPA
jgi:hypothetical protein